MGGRGVRRVGIPGGKGAGSLQEVGEERPAGNQISKVAGTRRNNLYFLIYISFYISLNYNMYFAIEKHTDIGTDMEGAGTGNISYGK